VTIFSLDPDGMPVLLADVPSAGVSRVAAGQQSGNPRHDVHSGKFGQGGGGKKSGAQPPANVDPVAFYRMLDAVRQAAREFQGELTPANIETFIRDHASNPQAVNLQQFTQLIHEQHLADLVDIIDGQTRGGQKTIKLTAPRAYLKQQIQSLNDADVAQVAHRLEQRGNSPRAIDKWFGRRIPSDRQLSVRQHKAALKGTT